MNTDRQLITTLLGKVTSRQAAIYRRIQSDSVRDKDVVGLVLRYDAIDETKGVLSSNAMIDILNNNLYEIYVCNPDDIHSGNYAGNKAGAVTGWDIKWILAPSDKAVKQYPFFDEIITKNDNSTGRARTAELFIQ